jgi:hypothetical protein
MGQDVAASLQSPQYTWEQHGLVTKCQTLPSKAYHPNSPALGWLRHADQSLQMWHSDGRTPPGAGRMLGDSGHSTVPSAYSGSVHLATAGMKATALCCTLAATALGRCDLRSCMTWDVNDFRPDGARDFSSFPFSSSASSS